MMLGEVNVEIVEPGTKVVVGQESLVVDDENCVRHGGTIWMTKPVWLALKALSKERADG